MTQVKSADDGHYFVMEEERAPAGKTRASGELEPALVDLCFASVVGEGHS
jgi:hypothetical protein